MYFEASAQNLSSRNCGMSANLEMVRTLIGKKKLITIVHNDKNYVLKQHIFKKKYIISEMYSGIMKFYHMVNPYLYIHIHKNDTYLFANYKCILNMLDL